MKQSFNPEIWLVERKPFNPKQWLQKPITENQPSRYSKKQSTTGILHEVEIVVRRIETHKIDLTMNYEDWLKLGFAFSEFGETGRGWFNRISRFYPGYDKNKCDRQFDKCLNGRKTGITIKTFFAVAHAAGVNVKV